MGVLVASVCLPFVLMVYWAVRHPTLDRLVRGFVAVVFCGLGFLGFYFDELVPRYITIALIYSGWLFCAVELLFVLTGRSRNSDAKDER
jgi:hypothetical protein